MNLLRSSLIVLACPLALASEVSSSTSCGSSAFPDGNIPPVLNSSAFTPGQEPLQFYVDQSAELQSVVDSVPANGSMSILTLVVSSNVNEDTFNALGFCVTGDASSCMCAAYSDKSVCTSCSICADDSGVGTRSLNVDVDCGNHKNGACSTPMGSCLGLGADGSCLLTADSSEGCVMTFAPTSPPTATSSSMHGAKLTNWVSGVCGIAGLVIITSMF